MVEVKQTSGHAKMQTPPVMAAQSWSCAHSVHIAWESETHTVASLDVDMAQNPVPCEQRPMLPYAAAVIPAMHWFVRFAQKFPLSLPIQSQFSGQVQSMEPPHPSEPEPQSSRLAGGSVAQVLGVQQLPSSRQTSAGLQHAAPWQTELPVGQQSSSL
jgi:hypothetical protein